MSNQKFIPSPPALADIFGYWAQPFPPSFIPAKHGPGQKFNQPATERKPEEQQFDGITYSNDEPEVLGTFGNAIFMPFKFEATSYQKYTNGALANFETPDLFLEIAIIDWDQDTNMEMTKLEGADGTVKEWASLSDFKINIKGVLVSDDDTYPSDQVALLKAVRQCPTAIDIACDELQALDIYSVVIKSIRWVATPGFTNCQAFELECYSDNDLLYQLNNAL